MIIALGSEPLNFSTLHSPGFGSAERRIAPAIFVSDVEFDASWRPFAKGMEYLPSVRDGTWKVEGERMTLLWRLRRRNWHDGVPVTCGDYVFFLRLVRDPRVAATADALDAVKDIASVSCPEGVEGRGVRIEWRRRIAHANMAPFPATFLGGSLPRHVLEPLYRQNPSRIREVYGVDPTITVGDGAYRIARWQRGESLTLEAVPDHWLSGTPKIRRITYRFIEDRDARLAALLAGTIDAIGDPDALMVTTLRRVAAGRVNVLVAPGVDWEHIDFNLDNPFLRDIRVRRAIAHGVNRTQIVQELFQGLLPAAHTYLTPRHPGFTAAVPRYPYDPARARSLLRDAGFTPGPDGIMRSATGERLSLELSTREEALPRRRVQQIMREQLRQVGIEINVVTFPARVFFSQVERRRFTAMVIYGWVLTPFSDCEFLYTSDAVPTEANGWNGGNYPGYRNREMDEACKGAAQALDPEVRNSLLQSSTRIFARDLPALPLYYGVEVIAAKAGLQNLVARGLPGQTWNAHTWYWK